MITREEYEALNAKVDMYIQCLNKLEKEYWETARDVHRLKQANAPQKLSLEQYKQLTHDVDKRLAEVGTACLV